MHVPSDEHSICHVHSLGVGLQGWIQGLKEGGTTKSVVPPRSFVGTQTTGPCQAFICWTPVALVDPRGGAFKAMAPQRLKVACLAPKTRSS